MERFAEHLLSQTFSYLYGTFYKGRIDIFDIEKYILEDFIRDKRGKVGERRGNEIQKDEYRMIEEVLLGSKTEKILQLKEDIRGVSVDKVIYFCGHVKDMKENLLPDICIDSHENLIANEQDYFYFRNYDNAYAFFRALYFDSVLDAICRIGET